MSASRCNVHYIIELLCA